MGTTASAILNDLTAVLSDSGDYYTQSGQTIYGIFDSEYRAIDLGSGDVASAKPAFVRKTADVVATAVGDTIVMTSVLYAVTSVSYVVVNIEVAPPDLGPGISRLVLKKA